MDLVMTTDHAPNRQGWEEVGLAWARRATWPDGHASCWIPPEDWLFLVSLPPPRRALIPGYTFWKIFCGHPFVSGYQNYKMNQSIS